MIKLKYKRETLLSINGQTSDYMTIRNIFSGNPMMIFLYRLDYSIKSGYPMKILCYMKYSQVIL